MQAASNHAPLAALLVKDSENGVQPILRFTTTARSGGLLFTFIVITSRVLAEQAQEPWQRDTRKSWHSSRDQWLKEDSNSMSDKGTYRVYSHFLIASGGSAAVRKTSLMIAAGIES